MFLDRAPQRFRCGLPVWDGQKNRHPILLCVGFVWKWWVLTLVSDKHEPCDYGGGLTAFYVPTCALYDTCRCFGYRVKAGGNARTLGHDMVSVAGGHLRGLYKSHILPLTRYLVSTCWMWNPGAEPKYKVQQQTDCRTTWQFDELGGREPGYICDWNGFV